MGGGEILPLILETQEGVELFDAVLKYCLPLASKADALAKQDVSFTLVNYVSQKLLC